VFSITPIRRNILFDGTPKLTLPLHTAAAEFCRQVIPAVAKEVAAMAFYITFFFF
jgi:hypothetical protein